MALTQEEKEDCLNRIAQLIRKGYPVFNLKSAFKYIAWGSFKTPCHQCIVSENGRRFVCGRCIEIEGLCNQCGYFFAAEYSLVFNVNIPVIADMLTTYLKYI